MNFNKKNDGRTTCGRCVCELCELFVMQVFDLSKRECKAISARCAEAK